MVQNYKIKVQVEIVASEEVVQDAPHESAPGQFEFVVTEPQAFDIDECEHALLRTSYPALRAA